MLSRSFVSTPNGRTFHSGSISSSNAPAIRRRRVLQAAVAVAAAAVSSASLVSNLRAADQTWVGNPVDALWSNAANWSGAAVPGIIGGTAVNPTNPDLVTFNSPIDPGSQIGSALHPITIDAAAAGTTPRQIGGILFDGAAGAYTIGADSTTPLWVTAAGTLGTSTRIQMNETVANTQTFNAPVTIRLPASTNSFFTLVNNSTTSSAAMVFNGTLSNASANTRPLTLILDGTNTANNTIASFFSDPTATTGNGAVHLVKNGTGVWVLSGANTIGQITSGGDNVPANAVVNDGTLVVQNSNGLGSLTASNVVAQGTGVLRLDNIALSNDGITLDAAGSVIATGNSSVNNVGVRSTAINVTLGTSSATDVFTVLGSVGINADVGSPATVINVAGPGQIVLNNGNPAAATWKVTGAGSLFLNGSLDNGSIAFGAASAGRVVLNGHGTTIGGLEGGAAGAIVENGAGNDITLNINSTTSQVYNGVIQDGSGGGKIAINKNGSGTLVLNHNQTYTGQTDINAGKLSVNGTWATGTINVNNNASVGGSAIASGTVSIHGGAHIAPGASVGTFSAAGLTLDGGSILDYEFNATANDKIVVTGNNAFTLNGGGFNLFQENSALGFTTAGTYQLVQFSGTMQGSGLDSSWTTASASNPHVLNPQAGLKYAFASSGNLLTLTISAGALTGHWAVDADGSWGTGANWSTNPNFPKNASEVAIFDKTLTATRTITLDGSKTVGGLQFDSVTAGTGYTIAPGSGGTLTVDNSGATATIVVVSGNNTIGVPVVLNSNTVTSVVPANASLTFTQSISGSGSLSKSGAGTVSLMAANSYGGNTSISGGTVQIGNNAAFSNSQVTVAGSTTLRPATPNLTIANNMTLGDNVTLTINADNNLTYSGSLNDSTGNGVVVKNGTGTLTLSGQLNQSGNTIVSAGTLKLVDGSNVGHAIVDNAAVVVSGVSDFSVGAPISGTGTVTKEGSNTVQFNNANTYAGPTNINAGTLKLGNSSGVGTGGLVVAAGATFDLNSNNTTNSSLTGSGVVTTSSGTPVLTINAPAGFQFGGNFTATASGTVGLAKTGAGVGTFSGTYSFNTLSAGGGTIAFTGNTSNIVVGNTTLNNGGALRIENGTWTMNNVTIPNSTSGDNSRIIITGGTVTFANYSGGRSGGTTTPNTATGLQISGGVVNANQVILSTTNSWSSLGISGGSLTIGAGSFILGNGNNGGRGGAMVQSGGSLSYAGPDGLVLANTDQQGVATFSGGSATLNGITLFKLTTRANGAATLAFSGNGTSLFGGTVYLGAGGINSGILGSGTTGVNVILNAGTLGATADWSATATLADTTTAPIPATLTGNINLLAADAAGVAHNITLGGVLSGTGGLTKVGAGTVMLSGNNTYTGATVVKAGKLVLTGNAKSPVLTLAGGADIQGGRLILDYNDTGTAPDVKSILAAGYAQTPTRFATGQLRTSNPDVTSKGLGWKDDATAKQVSVAYTWYGDANLDGQVDVTDLGALATNWQTSNIWAGGDFNYDGFVDVTDLGALATNWQQGVGNPLGPGSLESAMSALGLGNSAVPEPATFGLIGIGLAAAASRRRTRRSR